ncbi:thiamine-phosphate pyrophosphorylase [Pasteurella multocida subsp. multocida str. Anand1_buffalo]|nr:thiamine-phosphate pyrophosphorylase [Pasteurella multocida subsp. multocida str. Anand1_buffalo]
MVNDDVQLAIDIGADGIHVGQTDMAVADVAALCHSHCLLAPPSIPLSKASQHKPIR